jgi:osmotically-inducible protein OsmY
MKLRNSLAGIFAMTAFAILIVLSGCAATRESTHCDDERCADAALADKIESALRTAPGIEFWQVRVQYIHDTVYLYGLVETTPERTDIEHIASTVSGGKRVVNSISVRGYRH